MIGGARAGAIRHHYNCIHAGPDDQAVITSRPAFDHAAEAASRIKDKSILVACATGQVLHTDKLSQPPSRGHFLKFPRTGSRDLPDAVGIGTD